MASLVAQLVKNWPAMQETWVQSLGWEDSLEKGKTTHSSILAWRILKDSDTTFTFKFHFHHYNRLREKNVALQPFQLLFIFVKNILQGTS